MPELSQGKQFLYRLIVSQLQQDGFVNVATSLSIATVGQTKIIPSDRLNNLISLCAQVVRDTDAEVANESKDPTPTSGAPATNNNKDCIGMGSQQSAFYPTLSQIIQDRVASQNEIKEEETSDENMLTDKNSEMSQAALKSLHQLQMLKVFSNMTEATRQAYLQTQALQKKPFFLNTSNNTFQPTKDPVRPFPLSTPDIKTPQCRSTLLPFSTSTSAINVENNLSSYEVNGKKEDTNVEGKQNIDAMEEIIKQSSADDHNKPITTSSISTTISNTLPLTFLQNHADTTIQELLMQRQLKQRRFKDLDCSFVSQLIKPEHKTGELTSVLNRVEENASSSIKREVLPDSLLSTVNSISASTSASGEQARYECPRCARVFAYEYVLQTHMRQVCPDRSNYKHPCAVCKKRFQNQSSLKRHMIVHTGERKYECEVCHKRFGRSHHLKRHVKIHEMEAANYTQHQFQHAEGAHIPEETLQLLLQLGAMNKFPLSPASLMDHVGEDMSNDCDSIDDGESQGDMDDPNSDIGDQEQLQSIFGSELKAHFGSELKAQFGSELMKEKPDIILETNLQSSNNHLTSSLNNPLSASLNNPLSIQNIINNTMSSSAASALFSPNTTFSSNTTPTPTTLFQNTISSANNPAPLAPLFQHAELKSGTLFPNSEIKKPLVTLPLLPAPPPPPSLPSVILSDIPAPHQPDVSLPSVTLPSVTVPTISPLPPSLSYPTEIQSIIQGPK